MVDPRRQRLFELVSEAATGGTLSPFEQAEMRLRLADYMPVSRRLSWPDLVEAGLFTVGVWITFEPETLDVPT
jgi:hypothetical protein